MEGLLVLILVFAVGAFIISLAEKGYNTYSKEGVKERKIKEYRFSYFDMSVKKNISSK
jgi:hypothetical protein